MDPPRQRPGLGTVLNVLVVGTTIDIGLQVLPAPAQWWARGLLFVGGLLLLAISSGIYIGARLGAGPRDGLMLGLHSRFGVRIWVARSSVELSVLLVGWLLGGDVGIGTLLFAALIGPLCSVTLPLLGVRKH